MALYARRSISRLPYHALLINPTCERGLPSLLQSPAEGLGRRYGIADHLTDQKQQPRVSAGNLLFTGSVHLATSRALHRQYSNTASEQEGVPKHTNGTSSEMPVVYEGPYSSPLKNVKLLSVSTCALSVGLGPIITFYTMPGVDVLAKGAIAAILALASATTTGALHWLSSPYIHKMRWRKGSPTVDVETLTWLATTKREHLQLADVRFPYSHRPLSSFSVKGKLYYIENSLVESTELLKKLTP